MIKRIKIGVVLMLIGIGIPLVLAFFQKDGEIFKLTIEKHDKLREAEVKALNSLYDISTSYKLFADDILKIITDKQFEGYLNVRNLVAKLDKANELIEDVLRKAEIPNVGRIDIDKGSGKAKVIPPPGFVLDNPFVLLAPVKYSAGIPFNYSIGVGLIFFITGIGFVILSLIGRKGRTP